MPKLLQILFLLNAVLATSAWALPRPSRTAFRDLAAAVAPRVNLFRDAWREDPNAIFTGGTARDFLLWLLEQFQGAQSRADVEKIAAALKSDRKPIDIRRFIIKESDVDIVTARPLALYAADYGVKKIDIIDPARLDRTTPEGNDEVLQGWISLEKLRLGRDGLLDDGTFGDGLEDLLTSTVTVHFSAPEDFAKTRRAADKLNHPVLLALRYLRLVAANYYHAHGSGYPDPAALFALHRPSEMQVRQVIADACRPDPSGRLPLEPYLAQPRFRAWFDMVLRKAFRSYTNPTAAKLLFESFGVDKLVKLYGTAPTYNQYLFAQYRDDKAISAAFRKYKVKRPLFVLAVDEVFPDGFLYHGTKTEDDFRAILFQNTMPSVNGDAGGGLYGVGKEDVDFADAWAGDPDRVVKLPVKANAVLVDIATDGEGKRVWEAFKKANPGATEDTFAAAFGIDLLLYPYRRRAFVVKNSEALGRAVGHRRTLATVSELMTLAEEVKTDAALKNIFAQILLNRVSSEERALILGAIPKAKGAAKNTVVLRSFQSLATMRSAAEVVAFLSTIPESAVFVGQSMLAADGLAAFTHDFAATVGTLQRAAMLLQEDPYVAAKLLLLHFQHRGASLDFQIQVMESLDATSMARVRELLTMWSLKNTLKTERPSSAIASRLLAFVGDDTDFLIQTLLRTIDLAAGAEPMLEMLEKVPATDALRRGLDEFFSKFQSIYRHGFFKTVAQVERMRKLLPEHGRITGIFVAMRQELLKHEQDVSVATIGGDTFVLGRDCRPWEIYSGVFTGIGFMDPSEVERIDWDTHPRGIPPHRSAAKIAALKAKTEARPDAEGSRLFEEMMLRQRDRDFLCGAALADES